MNTAAGSAELRRFLARSPRGALDAHVQVADQRWRFQHGDARRVPQPVFEIGSVGKVFTTTLLALLVQRGAVDLSDRVARYVPGLPWAERVTLRHLASHTSGLPRDPVGRWRLLRHGPAITETFEPDDLMAFLRRRPPALREMGRVRYSNVGMALLGRILGDVCGQSYAAAVGALVLRPLGMHDTHVDERRYPAERRMQGHDARGRTVPPFVWRGMEPAGVWRSTGDDMITFLRAQMGFHGPAWASVAAAATRAVARVSRDTQVGLGWMLGEHDPLGRVAWHNGGTFGQHAVVAWALDRSAAVVVLTDRSPPLWHHALPSRSLEAVPQRLIDALRTAPPARREARRGRHGA